jgi:8-oxo-dGTP diphosphatase
MASDRPLLIVAAALLDGEGRVLLQQRAAGRQMEGLWEFPGGKIEPGEVPQEALARELKEELGIDVDPGSLRPATFASEPLEGRHMILLLYSCQEWRGVPEALDASALLWLRPEEMGSLLMPPADLPLVQFLKKSL